MVYRIVLYCIIATIILTEARVGRRRLIRRRRSPYRPSYQDRGYGGGYPPPRGDRGYGDGYHDKGSGYHSGGRRRYGVKDGHDYGHASYNKGHEETYDPHGGHGYRKPYGQDKGYDQSYGYDHKPRSSYGSYDGGYEDHKSGYSDPYGPPPHEEAYAKDPVASYGGKQTYSGPAGGYHNSAGGGYHDGGYEPAYEESGYRKPGYDHGYDHGHEDGGYDRYYPPETSYQADNGYHKDNNYHGGYEERPGYDKPEYSSYQPYDKGGYEAPAPEYDLGTGSYARKGPLEHPPDYSAGGYGEHEGYHGSDHPSDSYKERGTFDKGGPGLSCYQCAYSPSKVTHKTIKIPQESYHPYSSDYHEGPHTTYDTRTVAVTTDGGWDRCKGPFSHPQAKHFGVDVWACHHNCYVRVDYNGNLYRGCYKGEYGVNPDWLGCHYQADSLYCFCEGSKCNNGPPPVHRTVESTGNYYKRKK